MNFVVFSPVFCAISQRKLPSKKLTQKNTQFSAEFRLFGSGLRLLAYFLKLLSISLFGDLMKKSILLHICVLYHSVMPESVHDCPFFFRWANTVYCFTVALIIILSFLDTAFVLYLGNIQSGNLETVFLKDKRPYF